MTKYSDKAIAIKNALDARYENKVVNKKTSLTGDYSSDTTSYPTVQAVKDGLSGKADSSHNQASSTITNSTAFNNIKAGESTTLTLTDQAKINSAVNDAIGTLKGLKFLEIGSKPTNASASTMGKLYLEPNNNKIDIYYTKQSGTGSNITYSWARLENDILEDISISWNDVTGKPSFGTGASDFAAGNHTHSNYNKATYSQTVQSSATGAYEIGKITVDGTATTIYGKDTNTTYSDATTTASGLMSSTDKTKLNGIATGANAYTHPSQSLGTLPSSAAFKKIKYDANGHITAVADVQASDLPSHTHSYTTTSDVDTEIEAYLDAIISAYSS